MSRSSRSRALSATRPTCQPVIARSDAQPVDGQARIARCAVSRSTRPTGGRSGTARTSAPCRPETWRPCERSAKTTSQVFRGPASAWRAGRSTAQRAHARFVASHACPIEPPGQGTIGTASASKPGSGCSTATRVDAGYVKSVRLRAWITLTPRVQCEAPCVGYAIWHFTTWSVPSGGPPHRPTSQEVMITVPNSRGKVRSQAQWR